MMTLIVVASIGCLLAAILAVPDHHQPTDEVEAADREGFDRWLLRNKILESHLINADEADDTCLCMDPDCTYCEYAYQAWRNEEGAL